ncbi:hypothetical protein Y1Q_0006893 [Alligator mississippiensis]|uniref:Uncharacterized protein n=1 Tax=Alligator mississippiensis TaxID=8496 RepID=A0A151MTK2_ALLMI|nr:hypothetical protein Y1Q_0006893 [Alligator mississippiensis]
MLRKELDWPALAPSPLPQTQAGQPPIGSNNTAASASSRHPAEAISYSQLAPGKQQTKDRWVSLGDSGRVDDGAWKTL